MGGCITSCCMEGDSPRRELGKRAGEAGGRRHPGARDRAQRGHGHARDGRLVGILHEDRAAGRGHRHGAGRAVGERARQDDGRPVRPVRPRHGPEQHVDGGAGAVLLRTCVEHDAAVRHEEMTVRRRDVDVVAPELVAVRRRAHGQARPARDDVREDAARRRREMDHDAECEGRIRRQPGHGALECVDPTGRGAQGDDAQRHGACDVSHLSAPYSRASDPPARRSHITNTVSGLRRRDAQRAWAGEDSNLRLPGYEPVALTAELPAPRERPPAHARLVLKKRGVRMVPHTVLQRTGEAIGDSSGPAGRLRFQEPRPHAARARQLLSPHPPTTTRDVDTVAGLRARLERLEREAAFRQGQLERYASDLREIFKQERVRAQELQRSYKATVLALSNAVEARDAYTGKHAERVAAYGLRIAHAAGIPVDSELEFAFLLHDVGKVAVPDAILFKPGALTAEERTLVSRHAEIGSAHPSRRGLPRRREARRAASPRALGRHGLPRRARRRGDPRRGAGVRRGRHARCA